ncbi:MAG: ATP-binding protein [Planctomycetia bacterium]|nr:ATP-binding protein [Planctomycetia bacterium]
MTGEGKGRSPFNPGQPVPAELFTGRQQEIDRILQRGVGQTALGKPTAFFIQGEYGIGKSSIASFAQTIAERDHGLIGIYTTLGGVKTLDDLAASVLEATLHSGLYDPTWREQTRNWLAKYIGKQDLFGFSVNLEAIKVDAPQLASALQMLGFLREAHDRYARARGGKGVFLVLDEINGIAPMPEFAQFVKSLIDSNALNREPVPLLLMLCGTEERRTQMIECHPPTDRLFDVVDIPPMSEAEMTDFFRKAFESVEMMADDDAMLVMTQAAAGFPKIMHSVGDSVFWRVTGKRVDHPTAIRGVIDASREVGRKFVDAQVYDAIQSKDYQSILKKLANDLGPFREEFTRKDLAAKLNDSEKRKLDNFLQKLKKLNVIKSLDTPGRYQFRIKMVQTYIWLRSFEK